MSKEKAMHLIRLAKEIKKSGAISSFEYVKIVPHL